MPDMNQIEIPQSFMALFVIAGRLKLNAALEIVVSSLRALRRHGLHAH